MNMGKEYYIGTGFKNQGTVYNNGVYTACVLCDINKKTNTYDIVVPEQAESVGRKIQEYNDTYTYKHTIGIKQRDVVLSTILAVEADQLAVWKNIVNGKTLYNVYFVIKTNTTGVLYAGNELEEKGEVDLLSRYPSLRERKIEGDFRFVVVERIARNVDLPFSSSSLQMR
jgi:hypothetical protein